MTGRSHKAIGIATGIAITIYGIRQGNPAASLALVSAPLAAMLPDIDHNGSKIGKTRKEAMNFAVTATIIALIVAVWYYGWHIVNHPTVLIAGAGVIGSILLFFALSKSRWFKNLLGFATKHRGIMHTLLLPACMLFAARFINEPYFLILLYGFVAGYISHILADCLTKNGCPILFPLTQKNISLTSIKTGTEAEKMCMVALIAIILVVPIIFTV